MASILPASDASAVQEAARLLKDGGIVAIPTETVYGLAAQVFDPQALAKVFEAKGRPFFDPLIVHLASVSELDQVAQPNPRALELARLFWPGPLTLVLPKQPGVPDLATSGLPTVALRIPDHPATLALLKQSGPLAAPSANLFGRVSPTTADHVREQLGDKVSLILDGGPCRVGLESTILDLSRGRPRILRPGGLPLETLEAVLGPVELEEGEEARPSFPGGLKNHYATRTPLKLLAPGRKVQAPSGRWGALLIRGEAPAGFKAVEVLSPSGDLREAAAGLFAAMRRLDAAGLDGILAESPPAEGLGLAILDRLIKASDKGGGA
jgi:L-threonylcarbamoyladenylate synthase